MHRFTGQYLGCTVPQGWRRDEGVPPYRNGKRHSKRVLARGVIPAGGRGTPLPILPKVSTGIADLPAGTSLPSSTCQRLTVIADLPSWRTNGRETPYHFKAFPQSGKALFQSLFIVISTEVRVLARTKRRNPPRLSADTVAAITVFDIIRRAFHRRKQRWRRFR